MAASAPSRCPCPPSRGAPLWSLMISVPTNPAFHYVGDTAAWVAAALAARWQYRDGREDAVGLSKITSPSYFIALGFGALVGAWLLGSANSLRGPIAAPSHSIAGALAGGIVAVELWKLAHGVRSLDRRSVGAADLRRHHHRPARLLVRRPARLHLRRSDRACRGRWTSATASAAIPSSFMNPWRWPCSLLVYFARAGRQRRLGPRPCFPRDDYLLCWSALPVGIPQAVSGGARSAEPVSLPDAGAGRIWNYSGGGATTEASSARLSSPQRKAAHYLFHGQTTSLCETCLELGPGQDHHRGREGLLPEALPRHGVQKTLISDDLDYWRQQKLWLKPGDRPLDDPDAHRSRLPVRLRAVPGSRAAQLPRDHRDQRGVQPRLPGVLRQCDGHPRQPSAAGRDRAHARCAGRERGRAGPGPAVGRRADHPPANSSRSSTR